MSLYIGKDTNGKNILHITDTLNTPLSTMQSSVPTSGSLVHTNNKIMVLEEVVLPDVTQHCYVWTSGGWVNNTATYQRVVIPSDWKTTQYLFFASNDNGVTFDIVYSEKYITSFAMYGDRTPVILTTDPSTGTSGSYIASYTTKSRGCVYATANQKLIVKCYKLSVFTYTNNTIDIGNGEFTLCGVDLTNKMFLSIGSVNTVDTIFKGYTEFQILNSKYGLSTSSLGINGSSIGSYYNNVFYPIFGASNSGTVAMLFNKQTFVNSLNPSITINKDNDLLLISYMTGYVYPNEGSTTTMPTSAPSCTVVVPPLGTTFFVNLNESIDYTYGDGLVVNFEVYRNSPTTVILSHYEIAYYNGDGRTRSAYASFTATVIT